MNCFRPAISAWILFLFPAFLLPASLEAQLRFVPNAGQWQEPFDYRADVPGGAVFLHGNTIWYHFSNGAEIAHQRTHPHGNEPVDSIERGHAVAIEYLGASSTLRLSPENLFGTRYNYYLGAEKYWRSGLRASADIRCTRLYDGIDMLVEGGHDAMKYTYFVKRGVDPEDIRLKIRGASHVTLSEGTLRIITTVNEIREDPPLAWQWEGDKKIDVPCRYVLKDNVVSFDFPEGYNRGLDLIIDPKVVFASYSGSIADNFGYTATYDNEGHAYSGGDVWDQGYPVTAGAYEKNFQGGNIDAAIMKFTADGTKLIYATYLGGSSDDRPHSMVVNSDTELVVLGTTFSADFPFSKTALDTVKNNWDMFISRFSADGTKLLASTFIGGDDRDGINNLASNGNPLKYNYADDFRGEILVDGLGDIYVASTADADAKFPTTSGSMQPNPGKFQDAVVFRINKDLSKLKWSTFIGGAGCDAAYGIQFDSAGNVYVCGGTNSKSLFSDPNMYQDSISYSKANVKDSVDAFICHLTGDSGKFINGTYLGGGRYDQAYFVQVDSLGRVFVYGQTRSPDFPVVNPNYLDSNAGQFISILNPQLDSMIVSTRFGKGKNQIDISPTAFLVDNCGAVYISGWGGETNNSAFGGNGGSTLGMQITPDAFQKTTDSSDFYIAVFAPLMDTLLYGTFYGNSNAEEHVDGGTSRFDKNAIIYQSICGSCDYTTDPSPDPITTPGAHSRINKGKRPGSSAPGCNNLVLKLDVRIPDIIAGFTTPLACKDTGTPVMVPFINKTIRGKKFDWDFGDGTTGTGYQPVHAYEDTGTYTVRLIASNPNSCSLTDTFFGEVKIYLHQDPFFVVTGQDCDGTVRLQAGGALSDYRWDFGDGSRDTGRKVSHKFDTSGTFSVKLYNDSGTLCMDSVVKDITIAFPDASFIPDLTACDLSVSFKNTSANDVSFSWDFGDSTFSTQENPAHTYAKPGTYVVRLAIMDNKSCADTAWDIVTVLRRADPTFIITGQECDGTVFFEAKGDTKDIRWHFGDGATDTGRSVSHLFQNSGTYHVKLYTDSPTVCSDSSEQAVVIRLPFALFSYKNEECELLVEFENLSDNGVEFNWNFGDNTSDTVKHPVHTYTAAGSYNVSLTITDSAGCTSNFQRKITVIDRSDPAFVTTGQDCDGTVHFEATGVAIQYHWDFGTGAYATGQSVSHRYGVPGTYLVKLFADSSLLCGDSSQQPVTVRLPSALFTYTIDTCDLAVAFRNTSSNAVKFTWDFGDGNTDTVQDPTHIYKAPGSYAVSLTAVDTAGCSNAITAVINIIRDIEANFSFDTDTCTGKVLFHNLSKDAKTFLWNFGDGTSDTARTPVHYFPNDSQYTVTLVAISPIGCRDTFERVVDGVAIPEANFTYEKDSCSSEIKFESESFRGHSFAWIFGDGSEGSNEKAPVHAYDRKGTYTVQLIINPGSACADTAELDIYVVRDKAAPAIVPNVFTPNGDLKNDFFHIEGNSLCYEFEIEIYNRWGQLVFEEKGNPLVWDGRARNGNELPSGVYYYVFRDPIFGDKHGTVTLLRE